MKFIIYRTSNSYLNANSPCEEAVLVEHKLVYKNNDHEQYKNIYEIEINSLEDLINLSKKYGEIIINGNTLEIYDDYRE